MLIISAEATGFQHVILAPGAVQSVVTAIRPWLITMTDAPFISLEIMDHSISLAIETKCWAEHL